MWLVLLSVASLVVLVYAGVFTAFSVKVTPEMERASRLPGTSEPVAGSRALVVPISNAAQVPTFQNGLGAFGAYNGSLLLLAEPDPMVPTLATNASIARALAYVTPTANGSYVPSEITFVGLPRVEGNATILDNVTVNVTALAEGRSGFLVRSDADGNVTFAPTERVTGGIARFDPAPALVSLFAFGAFGFVAPIVMLIATHRGVGARGVAGKAGLGLCPECKQPLPPTAADFCTRCGAWIKGRT